MCTAATYQTRDHYLGRTLDYEFSYGNQVAVTPRNCPLPFRELPDLERHYAMVGMAHVEDGYPLYNDAVNERGLGAAGLNFVGNAVYHPAAADMDNAAQFELIPWLLGRCATVAEAREALARLNLRDIAFRPDLPPAQLHWILADRTGAAVTVEPMAEGVQVYENPVGVLTNNPPFPQQLFALNNYRALTPGTPENTFAPALALDCYSRGLGALGLPGDVSSQSRFVRAAFTRCHAVSGQSEAESVGQLFHILGSVHMSRGVCRLDDGQYAVTLYTSCCNLERGVYYYTTYENRQISAVHLRREDLDGTALVAYDLIDAEQIRDQN